METHPPIVNQPAWEARDHSQQGFLGKPECDFSTFRYISLTQKFLIPLASMIQVLQMKTLLFLCFLDYSTLSSKVYIQENMVGTNNIRKHYSQTSNDLEIF